ncbi:AraC family transcriptional regulator [Tautonia plasticadhaerens]|uniref:HTH-type transcriptional activator Btr n=1 Tax=Tautonia plasticadhaerens TaxID=2527974 RepID=A0A518H105_9BACT|nr:AraC family transcriptional regulator [Tautonia plasticadhaerens]QDV34498.1 HTH-type transcriptional activator Btr [Tautonia plasticadhaerens]
MDESANYRERLAGLLDEIAVEEGLQPTHIEGVHIFKGSKSVPRAPMVYRPHIIVVGQGRKHAYLGGEVYTYDPANYLVLAVPLPAECDAETEDGKPILMVNIDVDATMVGEMLLEIDGTSPLPGETPRGISSTPMNPGLAGAVIRLLECLKCPVDSRLLGRQMVREVVYRVLRGEQGGALYAMASRDDHFTRIARVLRHIHSDYAKPLGTEEMAKMAGMSVSVFHHHFKLVTASSPLQYLKRIRLDRARTLMTLDGYNAGTAAHAVGYESASQFGREFKRLFGTTPAEDAEQMRARLVGG